MKRGIKFSPMLNEPCALPAPTRSIEIMGYPVTFNPRGVLAVARGVWPFKRIVVGPAWLLLSPREQHAVLLHEAHHCRAWHMELRILALPFVLLPRVQKWARMMELAADAFAVREGYGIDLINLVVRRGDGGTDPFYPTHCERLAHLQRCIREVSHVKS